MRPCIPRHLARVTLALMLISAACAPPPAASPAAPPTIAVASSTPAGVPTASAGASSAAKPTAAAANAPAAKQGDTLRIVIGAEPGTFDPAILNNDQAINAGYEMVEGLTTVFQGDGEVRPLLAESWQSTPDALSYTFTLRTGVKFQDGTDFNAQAVKVNFDRITDPNLKTVNLALFSFIGSTTVIDDTHVRIDLKQPLGYLPAVLASYTGGILSPASLTASGSTYNSVDRVVGTGPYVFKEYTKAVHAVMDRNENYWGNKPAFKQLEFKIVPDAAAREAMLRSGDGDVIFQPPPSDIAALQKDSSVKVYAGTTRRSIHLALNTLSASQPLLRDVRVRQALNYAVDKKTIIQNILFGLAEPTDSPVPKSVPGYCPAGDYTYDPQKSKQLLQDAGAAGMTIKLQSPTGRYLQDFQAATAISGNFRDIGINVVGPTTQDFAAYVAAVQVPIEQATNEVGLFGLAGSYPEPGAAMSYFVSDRKPPLGFNLGYYSDPQVDQLVAKADANPDRTAAAADYCTAEKIVWDAAPWVFLWIQQGIAVYSPKLGGVKTLPNEMVNFDIVQPV